MPDTPAPLPPDDEARAALDGLRALSDAATPGPWQHYGDHIHGPNDPVIQGYGIRDAAFIAAAVNYVRDALDGVR